MGASEESPIIHVFCGTKAQYMKMAPILRRMDGIGVDYRLIDSGQHAGFNARLRPSLKVREPDVLLATEDARTVPQGLVWAVRLLLRALRRRQLLAEVFGGRSGVCVVHGDTASTLIGAILARRCGIRVVHVEAGLRSGSLRDPFPEEAIRVVVPRMSSLLFPPDRAAEENLRRMGVRGRIVRTDGNTVTEVLFDALEPQHGLSLQEASPTGPVLMQLHRLENLHDRQRLADFVALARSLARDHPVRFVLHASTEEILERRGLLEGLHAAGVEVSGLLPSYRDFARLLRSARFVIADGASLQEECAALGVPMLLWRKKTERPDGIGANVVLSHHDAQIIRRFLDDPGSLRRPPVERRDRPSVRIVEEIVAERA